MIIDSQMTELGYSLKSYRVRNNITQQELADRLGVSTNTIHLWETKVCKPSMGSLLILSDMLNEPLINIKGGFSKWQRQNLKEPNHI